MAIKIKKSHKGLLHKNLGVPQGEKIPASKLKIKESDSTAVKKRKVFAQNAKKWHHPNGGYLKYDNGGNNASRVNENGIGTSGLSQDWGNISTASTNNNTPTMNAGAKYGAAFAQNLASGIPSLASTYQNPQATAADKTRATAQMTGDAAVSAIPGFGAFYGIARGITSTIQDAIPGKDMVDKKTGVHMNVKNSQVGRAADQWLTPDHTHASNSWALAAAADKPADKAKYAMMGIGDLFGVTKIARVVQSAMGKNPEGLNLIDPKIQDIQDANSKFPTYNPNILQDNTQIAANGGFGNNKPSMSNHLLEKYKVLPHSQLNPNFANAHLDGKPIQLEKNETIFRAANGGDYAFSPNIKADSGRTIADESRHIEKLHSKPYFDKVAEDTMKLSLNNLVKENETKRIAKESKGLAKASGGLGSYNIDGSYSQPSFIGTGGKIDALLNQDNPVYETNFQFNNSNSKLGDLSGNLDLTTNKGALSEYIPNSPKLNNRIKPLENSNNLTTGDYLQLAGQLPALGYNAAMAFKKPEKQKLYQDLSTITPNQQGIDLNPMFLAENSAFKTINEGTSSDAVRRANLANIASGTQRNIADALLQNKNLNSNLRTQFEQRIADRSRFNIAQKLMTDDINAKNRAAQRMFGATAASNLGQGLTTFGVAKNQAATNKIQLSTLNELAANYGVDAKTIQELIDKGAKFTWKGKVIG